MPKWRKRDFELEFKAREKQILDSPLNYEKWPHSPDCDLLIDNRMETNENQPSTFSWTSDFSNQPRHQFCYANYATYGQDSQNSSSFLAMETDDRSPQPPQNDLRDAVQERKTNPNLQEDTRIEEMKKIMTIPLYFASGKPGRVDPKMQRMPSNFLQRFAAAKI